MRLASGLSARADGVIPSGCRGVIEILMRSIDARESFDAVQ